MLRQPVLRAVLIVAAVAAVFVIGYRSGGRGQGAPAVAETPAAAAEPTVWTCSMHPQFKLPAFGQCPICFMDLIPLEAGDDEDTGPASVSMSARAAALAEIRTARVDHGTATAEVRLVGRVVADESRTRTITARVPGRIDTLFVDTTGAEVAPGQALASLYSPALFAAQTELLGALAARDAVARSASPLVRETAAATVASARRRLSLWGLEAAQIAAVEQGGRATDRVRIAAPLGGVVIHKEAVEGLYVQTGARLYTIADLSRVWIELDAYESDLAWLRVGQDLRFTVEAWPGEALSGRVVFIDPLLDPRTRTVTVRLEADNADGRLKPGMFVGAVVEAAPEPDARPLLIPATAPLITGKRAVVYVQLPDRERPTFTGREVTLGPRVGDHYIVAAGLAAGETVVVHGAFKIDSALQIQAKPSMMNPGGGGPAPGHDHGDHGQHAAATTASAAASPHATPPVFRSQLDAVLAAYLAAQTALAADDDPAAALAARSLVDALAGVDMGLLSGEAHDDWMRDQRSLQGAAAAFSAAGGVTGRRASLRDLSDILWTVLQRYGVGREETVRRFHCPMADDNRGAHWLQLGTETANPYFGASMLRCGSQADTLAGAAREDGS
jgi:Cu(I)/Ag(I) efflux system membrane fusion protein